MENKGILMKMLDKNFRVLFISCLLVFGICNYANASEFGPFQGKIIDAETKEPIEGVVVLIEWRQYRLSSLFENTIFYDAQETLTDKSGEFYIPGIWILNPWTRLMLESHVIIYKSGYGTIDGEHIRDLAKALSAKKDGTPRVTYISSFQDGKPVIILKKLTVEERKRYSTPGKGDAPCDKAKLLIQEMNKENKFLGLGKEGCL